MQRLPPWLRPWVSGVLFILTLPLWIIMFILVVFFEEKKADKELPIYRRTLNKK
jgi:hypothetical protein